MWVGWAPTLLPGGTGGVSGKGGVPGSDGISSRFSCLHWSGGDSPVPWRPQHVWGLFAVPFRQGRHLFMWFWWSVAGALSIAAFTFLYPGNSTLCFFSSRTLASGFLIRYCFSSVVAFESPPIAILAKFMATCMSDGSSCTRPQCLAMVADMVITHEELVAAVTHRVGYYLDHIGFGSLLQGDSSLFRPHLGLLITKFVCKNASADNIMMFNFGHCADKCLGWL